MWLLRKLSATIIAVIIIIIAVFYFINHIETLSLPNDFENISDKQLIGQISVYQNNLGISHIIANNESDAYFMLGFIQARDRLWQMDIKRRTALGKLSEIFGKYYIDYDKFLRSLNLVRVSNNILKTLDKRTLLILKSYSNGINKYIKKHSSKLSFEFSALNYKPNIWEPIDCILLQRLFAIQTSPSFKYEIKFGEIAEKIGLKKSMLLLPDYPVNSPYVLSDQKFKPNNQFSKDISKYSKSQKNIFSYLQSKYTMETKSTNIYEKFFKPNLIACNNWAIANHNINSKTSVLANDFHSQLDLPSMWYPVHITYRKNNIIGFMLPGIPVFWAGRNNKFSWGISSTMLDDCDFFIEKSINKKQYINSKNDTLNFKFIKDTIKIKNAESYYYYKVFCERSPILINYVPINNKKISSKNNFSNKYSISFNWVGSEPSDEISSLIKISCSSKWVDVKQALKTWSVPSLSFSYADSSGNIGLISCGKILNRNKKTNPYLPNPSWLSEYDSHGTKKGNILGLIYNPKKQFVSASNNIIKDTIIPYISNYWEPDSREKRIEQLIGQYQTYKNYQYNYLDAQRMQLDKYSDYAKEIFNKIIPILKLNFKNLTNHEQKVLERLEKWDYLMSPEKVSPTIYKTFIYFLEKNIFSDDLGKQLFNKYSGMHSLILRKLLDLLNNKSYDFFDNVRTKAKESKTYIIVTSFKETVEYLKNKYNTKTINELKYSKLNKIILSHNFINNKFLKPVVEVKPIAISGDRTTINLIDIPFISNNKNCIGPSYRMIADVADSLILISFPGGISGDPLNPNYKNIVQVWKNGGYIKLNISRKPDKSFKLKLKAIKN